MKAKRSLILFLIVAVSITVGCTSTHKKKLQSQDSRRIGEAYMAKANYSRALKHFLEAEAAYAEDHILQDDLGKVYIAKGKYDLAISHFKQALKLEPDFAAGKNNLGSAYLLAEDWDSAIVVFEELNEDLLYGTPHFPMYNLGWAYYNKKEYKTAISYYNKSLKLQHGFILALRGLGLAWQKLGRKDLAIKYFEKAAANSPRFPQLYFDLGNAYASNNQVTKAIRAYDKVTMIKPDSDLSETAQSEIIKLRKVKIN